MLMVRDCCLYSIKACLPLESKRKTQSTILPRLKMYSPYICTLHSLHIKLF